MSFFKLLNHSISYKQKNLFNTFTVLPCTQGKTNNNSNQIIIFFFIENKIHCYDNFLCIDINTIY